jgi:hypothetical protein
MKDNMKNLNECAKMIYANRGNCVEDGFDFSKSRHPEETECFVIAVKTCNFWKDIFVNETVQESCPTEEEYFKISEAEMEDIKKEINEIDPIF